MLAAAALRLPQHPETGVLRRKNVGRPLHRGAAVWAITAESQP